MAMMISKFNRLIQSKLVWWIFLGVVIIGFVLIYIPGLGNRRSTPKTQHKTQVAGKIFGKEISRQEFREAYNRERISYILKSGQYKITKQVDNILIDRAWQRIAMLKKAKQQGLMATTDEIKNFIRSNPMFKNNNGQFDPNIFKNMQQALQQSLGMGPSSFEQYMAEEVIIENLMRIQAQAGLATETEIKERFHLLNDQLVVQYAKIPQSDADEAAVTDENALAYYEANPEEFKTPEKVKVSYIPFPISNYTNEVVISDEMLTTFYENNKQRYVITNPDSTNVLTETHYKPLEEVKPSIITELKKNSARKLATTAADQLVSDLSEDGAKFDDVIEANGLAFSLVKDTPAFAKSDYVKGVDFTAPFIQEAFMLHNDDTHYYSDPVVGREVVYIIRLINRLEPTLPAFEEVKEDVIAATSLKAKNEAYEKRATSLYNEIKTALAEGTSFSNALAKVELTPKITEPFTVLDQLSIEYAQDIQFSAAYNEKGVLCKLTDITDGKLIAYVSDRIKADEITLLPEMRENIVNQLSTIKSGIIIRAWKQKILDQAGFENLLDLDKDTSNENS